MDGFRKKDFARWSRIRTFGKIKYFNISYIVLLIVPLVYDAKEKIGRLLQWVADAIPLTGSLKWLYAASVLYAIGIALYQLFCPKIIKRYESEEEYIDAEFDQWKRVHPHHRLDIVRAGLDPRVDDEASKKIEALLKEIDQASRSEQLEPQNKLDELLKILHADVVQRFLLKKYESEDVGGIKIVRWMAFLCYVFGSLIVLAILIVKSVRVFSI